MANECVNGLLPDGPVCPGCGGKRAPSGIDGGTWVHIGGERLATIYGSEADRMPPMAQSTAERQKAFKESMREAGFVRLEAWVTKEQRDKFRSIGGDEWLRKKIDAAKQQSDKR